MVRPLVSLSNNDLEPQHARETKRQKELSDLIAQGKVPHQVELQNHPEKSLQGLSCKFHNQFSHVSHSHILGLMGRVAGSINDIKPAKDMSASRSHRVNSLD